MPINHAQLSFITSAWLECLLNCDCVDVSCHQSLMLQDTLVRFIRRAREVCGRSIMLRLPSPAWPTAFLAKVPAVGGVVGPGNNGSDRYQVSPDTLSGTTLCARQQTLSRDIRAVQSMLLLCLLSSGSSYQAASLSTARITRHSICTPSSWPHSDSNPT